MPARGRLFGRPRWVFPETVSCRPGKAAWNAHSSCLGRLIVYNAPVVPARGVAQLGLACLTGGQEVEGSNPSAPSKKARPVGRAFLLEQERSGKESRNSSKVINKALSITYAMTALLWSPFYFLLSCCSVSLIAFKHFIGTMGLENRRAKHGNDQDQTGIPTQEQTDDSTIHGCISGDKPN